MRRNQLAVLGKEKGKDPGFHCMTVVSSYHSYSRRPEEKKEGKVGERGSEEDHPVQPLSSQVTAFA